MYIFCFSFFRSSDGNTLLVASTDGFCSVVNFKEGEIGEIYDENSVIADQAVKQTKGKPVSQVGSPNVSLTEIKTFQLITTFSVMHRFSGEIQVNEKFCCEAFYH